MKTSNIDDFGIGVSSHSEVYQAEEQNKTFEMAKDEETATTFSDFSLDAPTSSGEQQQQLLDLTAMRISSDMITYLDARHGSDPDHSKYSNVNNGHPHQKELDQVLEGYYQEKTRNAARRKSYSTIHDRLYRDGQTSAMRKAYAHQQKVEADKKVVPPKLKLATRSYTPLKERDRSVNAHERLYNIGVTRKKKAIEEEAKNDAYLMKNLPKHKPSTDGGKVVSRLYDKSKNYREDGKKKRQEIAKRLKGRDPTPTRSISVARAQKIYERGQAFNATRDKKIEEIKNAPRISSFPKMRTQTPSRRETFYDARDDQSMSSNRTRGSYVRSQTPNRSRSQTPNRARSQTPSRVKIYVRQQTPIRSRTSTSSSSRQSTPIRSRTSTSSSSRQSTPSRTRSRTPSRSRSQTPNRRVSGESSRPQPTPSRENVPKLPPRFKTHNSED